MPRVRTQLAIQAPPELLERLRVAAAAQRRTVTAVVVEAIEATLSGGLPAVAAPAAAPDLLARVEALEAAVAALRPPASPIRVIAAPQAAESPPRDQLEPEALPLVPESGTTPGPVEQIPQTGDVQLTTRALSRRTGTSAGAWNNWAGTNPVGSVRHHSEAGSWRLIGKAPAPRGGPPRWLWEPA